MHNSKKGGIASEEVAGLLIVMFVAAIVFSALYIIDSLKQKQKQQQVETNLEEVNANNNLVYFLRYQVQGDNLVADLINDAYLINNYQQLESIPKNFFGNLYGPRSLSYDVIINGKSMNSVVFLGKPIESNAEIPLFGQGSLKIELYIGQAG